MVTELAFVIEGVDGNGGALEVGERVAPSRDLLLDARDARRVEPDQRDREPRPQLVLELPEHVLGCDHQDPLASPTADQLDEHKTDLQGLAQPDDVRDQDAWPQAGQGQLGRTLLVGEGIEQEPVSQGEAALGLRQRRAATHRLQEEPPVLEPA